MGKALVKRRYHDRLDNKVREIGSVLDAEEPRLSELEGLGFIERLPEEDKQKADEAKATEGKSPDKSIKTEETKATTKTTRKPKIRTPEA